jgi:hypothetical protein
MRMAYPTRGRARGNAHQDTAPISGVRATGAARGRQTWLERAAEGALGYPLFVGIVHFLIVQVAATLAFKFGTPYATSAPYNQGCNTAAAASNAACSLEAPISGFMNSIVSPLRLWDGLWYKLIAEQGYGFGSANAAFWPLLPWLMRWGHKITGLPTDIVGYLIANISFIVALVLLYRLIRIDFDQVIARRTLWAIAIFPTALFFSAVYTESLFLMLAVGALLAARVGNWWMAGIAGALAALTRSYGVLLLVPFAVLFLQQYKFRIPRWFPNAVPAALPVLGPLIFGWHLDRVWNNFWAFKDVQEEWWRTNASPFETMRCAISGCVLDRHYQGQVYPTAVDGADWGWIGTLFHHPNWHTLTSQAFRFRVAQSDTLELVCTIGFLLLALIGLKLLPLYQSAYLIPGLVIPLFDPSAVHPLMSMPRFGLTLFPLFIVIALLVRRRQVAMPLAIISMMLLVIFTVQFANWYWVS